MVALANGTANCTSGGSGLGVVEIEIYQVFAAASLVLIVSSVCLILRIRVVAWRAILGAVRTILQLGLLGYVLKPIFEEGLEHPSIPVGYVVAMAAVAGVEASARSKYTYAKATLHACLAMLCALIPTAFFAFYVVIVPEPVWSPQYVIPVCGMLLGNCINGISLAFASLLADAAEKRGEVEVQLCFGATWYEAGLTWISKAIITGLTPTINGMMILGLVSIPGMMTGQILGGSTPVMASRYQIIIMFLILSNSFWGTLAGALLSCTTAIFDRKNHSMKLGMIKRRESKTKDPIYRLFKHFANARRKPRCKTVESPNTKEVRTANAEAKATPFTIFKSKHAMQDQSPLLEVSGAEYCLNGDVLFKDIDISLHRGQIVCISGPSGCGKSTLLRIVSRLSVSDTEMVLMGSTPSVTEWRRQVHYFSQTVTIPGSPADLCTIIAGFASNDLSPQVLLENASLYALRFGLPREKMQQLWRQLSGGEAQRARLAITLAFGPRVLLLDEPTSALDAASKEKVIRVLVEYCDKQAASALIVTHDLAQVQSLVGPGTMSSTSSVALDIT